MSFLAFLPPLVTGPRALHFFAAWHPFKKFSSLKSPTKVLHWSNAMAVLHEYTWSHGRVMGCIQSGQQVFINIPRIYQFIPGTMIGGGAVSAHRRMLYFRARRPTKLGSKASHFKNLKIMQLYSYYTKKKILKHKNTPEFGSNFFFLFS